MKVIFKNSELSLKTKDSNLLKSIYSVGHHAISLVQGNFTPDILSSKLFKIGYEIEVLDADSTFIIGSSGTSGVLSSSNIGFKYGPKASDTYRLYVALAGKNTQVFLYGVSTISKLNFILSPSEEKITINGTDYSVEDGGGNIDSCNFLNRVISDDWTNKARVNRIWVENLNGVLLLDCVPYMGDNNMPCLFDKVSRQKFYSMIDSSGAVTDDPAQAVRFGYEYE